MVSKMITVASPVGLHLRPAGVMCKMAMEYPCHIELRCGDVRANAKSVLSVLGACIKEGSQVELVCEGEGEEQALKELGEWIENQL